MHRIPEPDSIAATEQALAHLEQDSGLKLGASQRRRLQWLMARHGAPAPWKSGTVLPEQTTLAMVIEPPNSLELERLHRALAADAVVVVPYAEDPIFDSLKSRFFDFGTVGAAGSYGPHQMWWGGRRWDRICVDDAATAPLVVSCHTPASFGVKAQRLARSADALALEHVIARLDAAGSWEMQAAAKVEFIWRMWHTSERPLLWVEPDAVLRERPSLPAAAACDFAVHRRDGCEFDAGTIYFGRSASAKALLQTWHKLCLCCPGASDRYLLDQAWCLVSAQMGLDTVWLPRSYCATRHALAPGESAIVLQHGGRRRFSTVGNDVLPALEPDPSAPARAARRHCRTGAPEPQLVIRSGASMRGHVIALVRDHRGRAPFAATVERLSEAFEADTGGFDHLEIILCRSNEDFHASLDVAGDAWVLVTGLEEPFGRGAFRAFADALDAGFVTVVTGADETQAPAAERHEPTIALRSVKARRTVLSRAHALRAEYASQDGD